MINLLVIDLPHTVSGYTKKIGDHYTIVLNARHSVETQRDAYQHELSYIKSGHYDREDTLTLEKELRTLLQNT